MSDPQCPFCNSSTVEQVGQWGGQMITAQWRCCDCNSYFEAVRAEFDAPAHEGPPTRSDSTLSH